MRMIATMFIACLYATLLVAQSAAGGISYPCGADARALHSTAQSSGIHAGHDKSAGLDRSAGKDVQVLLCCQSCVAAPTVIASSGVPAWAGSVHLPRMSPVDDLSRSGWTVGPCHGPPRTSV
jgi:hypothetical protein